MNKCDDATKESFSPTGYYYDAQIAKYLIQVMSIFGSFYVKTGRREDGEEKFIHAHVHYGSRDRVTASMISDYTQNKPIKVPAFSVYKTGLSYAPNRAKGIDFIDRQSYLPTGGALPDDIKVRERIMPVPYDMSVEVSIIASNTQQQFQLLEQITMLFNPLLQIQKTDNIDNWESLTTVNLEQILYEENYPPGEDRRLIVTPMIFNVPIWITTPINHKSNFVKELKLKLGTLPHTYDINVPLEQYEGDPNVDIRDIGILYDGEPIEGPFDD